MDRQTHNSKIDRQIIYVQVDKYKIDNCMPKHE